jgi:hypothetical protein
LNKHFIRTFKKKCDECAISLIWDIISDGI